MTEHRRFMTYTQMEKAYRRILARRTCQKRGKLLTPNREIAETIDGSAWIGKERSDRLTPLRLMIIGGRAKARPIRHLSHGLERITA
jgi:hypothetical protein